MADIAQQNLPKQPKSSVTGFPQSFKKKASEAQESAPSQVEDVKSQTHEATQTGTQNGEEYENQTNDENETVDEEEGTEAIPAGSVDDEGNVVDEEGKVVGQ
jgi:hypothetical protein